MEDLRSFLHTLSKEHELKVISEVVDPYLEIAEIHRRTVASNGPALLFTNVKNSHFPVATNLFGSKKRINLAFRKDPNLLVSSLKRLLDQEFSFKSILQERKCLYNIFSAGTKKVRTGPVLENHVHNLNYLPILTTYKEDGGPFVTLPLVYTESPLTGKMNLGMYRLQRHSEKLLGLHAQIGKGAGFHLFEAEHENRPLPVSIFLGGSPLATLASISPLPENLSEYLFASILAGEKLPLISQKPHPLLANAEFAILGTIFPHERMPEGPFGDHYGYYGTKEMFPYMHVETIHHRENAIYPATVVGKPRQEDFYIGEFLNELFLPICRLLMPNVDDLWSYPESGFHAAASVKIKERYSREALKIAFQVLGEGQLSLTKSLFITDAETNIRDFKALLTAVLSRFDPEKDLYIIPNTAYDTLDSTSARTNLGSKVIFIGTGKDRRLPDSFSKALPMGIQKAHVFAPGCLVLEGSLKNQKELVSYPPFSEFPLLILTDSIDNAKDTETFLWTLFTRFEPDRDIYGAKKIVHNHIVFSGPILIDARMKAGYPAIAEVDPETKALVSSRWHSYGGLT